MRITVRPIGLVRRYVREGDLDVPDCLTSRDLIGIFDIPGEFKMVSLVNGRKRNLDEPLQDGDEIRLVTLLTGG